MIGSIGGGIVATKFGRKMSNAVGCTLQIFGILATSINPSFIFSLIVISHKLTGFCPDIYIFLIARAFVGAGIGITAVVCPLYVSENAEPSRRGVMGVLFQLAICFGILVSNIVGWGLGIGMLTFFFSYFQLLQKIIFDLTMISSY